MPPDILDYPTSTDMVVREGSNVTLRCAAVGSPAPAIVWRREAGDNISLQDGEQGKLMLLLIIYPNRCNTQINKMSINLLNDLPMCLCAIQE